MKFKANKAFNSNKYLIHRGFFFCMEYTIYIFFFYYQIINYIIFAFNKRHTLRHCGHLIDLGR